MATSPNDELDKQDLSPDELRQMTGIGEDEEGAMEREAHRGAASDIINRNSPGITAVHSNQAKGIGKDAAQIPSSSSGANGLKSVEPWHARQKKKEAQQGAQNAGPASANPLKNSGFFNNSEKSGGRLKGAKARIKQLSKNRTVLFGGGGVGLLILLFFILIISVGSLKLPDVMEGIESYEFAAVGNQFSKTTDSITDENLTVDDATDGVWSGLKERYQNLRDATWGKMDAYRPDKIIENLGENDGFQIRVTKTAFGTRLEGIDIRGASYDVEPITGLAKWTPGLNNVIYAKNRIAFENSGYIQDLNFTMKDNGTGDIARSLTMLKVEQLSDGTFAGWALSLFGNKDGQEPTTPQLDAIATKEQAESAQAGMQDADNPVMTQTADADQAAEDQDNADTNSEAKLEENDSDGGWLPDVLAAANSKLNVNLVTKILHITGFVYLILAPICIAFDGSVQHSQPTIDNNVYMLMDSYDQLAAEADQQKQGDTNLNDGGELENAVEATNDEIGDISASNDIAYQRAYGHVQSTTGVPSAEAGSDGSYSYSIFNALGVPANSIIGKSANAIAIHFCGVLTSTWTSAGLTLAQVILSIITFGASDAGVEAAGEGATTFIQKYVESLFATQVVKDETGAVIAKVTFGARAFRFAKLQAGILTGTVALAEATHLEVSARSGEASSGLAQGGDLLDEADEGGLLEANQVMRMAMFGRPLLASEVAAEQQASIAQVDYENSQKSFTDRYFALSNYDSLLTHLGMDLGASDRASDVASIVRLGGSILRPVDALASLIGSINGAAYAAPAPSQLDYGDVQFGWPASEETVINSSKSYDMLENQRILDQSGNEDAIAQQFAPCFGYQYNAGGDGNLDPDDPNGDLQIDPNATIGYLLSTQDIWRDNTTGDVINSPDGSGLCDPDRLSYDNTEDSIAFDAQSAEPDGGPSPQAHDMVFRWRLAMEYLTTIDQLTKEQDISPDDPGAGPDNATAAFTQDDGGFYQPNQPSAYASNTDGMQLTAKHVALAGAGN